MITERAESKTLVANYNEGFVEFLERSGQFRLFVKDYTAVMRGDGTVEITMKNAYGTQRVYPVHSEDAKAIFFFKFDLAMKNKVSA